MFKLWSQLNSKAKEQLKPNLGMKSWSDLDTEEKRLMWKYLEYYFFESGESRTPFSYYNVRVNYKFFGKDDRKKDEKVKKISRAILLLNERYKSKSFGRDFLDSNSFTSACKDFYRIFTSEKSKESEAAVLDM
ncbi:MAG: hypothetical protein ABIE14_00700, partial [Patescibacteria group bacterium]